MERMCATMANQETWWGRENTNPIHFDQFYAAKAGFGKPLEVRLPTPSPPRGTSGRA
jgi:hypothetical protein